MKKHNRYHQTMEQIKAPPALKEQTRQAMKKAARRHSAAKIFGGLGSVAAAAAVLFLLLPQLTAPSNSPLLTDLTPGVHAGLVESTHGDLQFTQLEPKPDKPIQLAPAYPVRQTLSLEEFQSQTGQNPLPEQPPAGYTLTSVTITGYARQLGGEYAAFLLKALYIGEHGQEISLTISNDKTLFVPPSLPLESALYEQAVWLGYEADSGDYHGIYERNNFTHWLHSQGANQEEFVLLLCDWLAQ